MRNVCGPVPSSRIAPFGVRWNVQPSFCAIGSIATGGSALSAGPLTET